jgi:hypothetical protein
MCLTAEPSLFAESSQPLVAQTDRRDGHRLCRRRPPERPGREERVRTTSFRELPFSVSCPLRSPRLLSGWSLTERSGLDLVLTYILVASGGYHVGNTDRRRSHNRRTSFSVFVGAWSKTERSASNAAGRHHAGTTPPRPEVPRDIKELASPSDYRRRRTSPGFWGIFMNIRLT